MNRASRRCAVRCARGSTARRTRTRSAAPATTSPRRSADSARLAELRDLVAAETPVGEGLVGVLPGPRRVALDLGRRATEARRRGRLVDATTIDDRLARLDVRVRRRFRHREHRCEACVAALEDLHPLFARLRLEDRSEAFAQHRPADAVHLRWQVVTFEAETLDQLGVELRFERTERDVLAVPGLVRVVERRAGVEDVGAERLVPEADLLQAP